MIGPEDFFTEQLAIMESFLSDPARAVQVVRIDPEMRRMPLNYLMHRDEDDSFPHLLFPYAGAFDAPASWFGGLSKLLTQEVNTCRADLAATGADLAWPEIPAERAAKPWEVWLEQSAKLADGMPDYVGALVFLIEPARVADSKVWNQAVRFLANRTGTPRVKYLILEERLRPALVEAIEHPRIGHQLFWLSPAEIERRAERVLVASQGARRLQ